jgi:hypothetical protein
MLFAVLRSGAMTWSVTGPVGRVIFTQRIGSDQGPVQVRQGVQHRDGGGDLIPAGTAAWVRTSLYPCQIVTSSPSICRKYSSANEQNGLVLATKDH